jgi:hypothetical protein
MLDRGNAFSCNFRRIADRLPGLQLPQDIPVPLKKIFADAASFLSACQV